MILVWAATLLAATSDEFDPEPWVNDGDPPAAAQDAARWKERLHEFLNAGGRLRQGGRCRDHRRDP